eukprot:gnl/MRDRNA2_/MRDRNA2_15387_c0_seq1.p1 gnl/MRDRNA2_/MRDRNA2_15387_c0~~gnl/MRDRNA2_/MRDRNA2_15387_c0_seq1.p1  ORF type:complete len:216 (-),score=32.41 gnl/MRDRNA2_/MRDRNA2_15387_c0_seq1:207-854(-)
MVQKFLECEEIQAKYHAYGDEAPAWKSKPWLLKTTAWALLYKASWISTIVLAAKCHPWCACLPMLLWVAARYFLAYESHERPALLRTAALAGSIGYIADSVLFTVGSSMMHPLPCSVTPTPGPDPVWMISLWVGFGAITNWSHVLFNGRTALCILLGAFFGPLAYIGGSKLGALVLVDSFPWIVGVEYGICFPVLVKLAGWELQKIEKEQIINLK